ncbi:MAG TPA: hypothetical protein VNH11_32035 [Pirellulales bacterium]|nr:hypothetical protein [Pirellulales bacterium]
MSSNEFQSLAAYQKLLARAEERWPTFIAKRQERLTQWQRQGRVAEKVAESILEDLLTEVLDWTLGDLNNQLDYADLVVTQSGIKRFVIEAKRPGALAWNRQAVVEALEQARRYAGEQRVTTVAISDGIMLFAADVEAGGLRDRLYVSLQEATFPSHLWWLSRDGIYRPAVELRATMPEFEHAGDGETIVPSTDCAGPLLHPKYHLPATCFAYVRDASKPSTWKLPYLHADGSVDEKRMPKAIQCLLTNYRGARVGGIPESAVPDTLVRLAQAAARLGRMPEQNPETADIYRQLATVLRQLDRPYQAH